MQRNLKHLALITMSLCANFVFAGAMGPGCSVENVTVPCEHRGWEVSGQALYLQPSATTLAKSSDWNNNTLMNLGVNPNWSWGFQLEALYEHHVGNDIKINWYHYRNSNSMQNNVPIEFSNFAIPGSPHVNDTLFTSFNQLSSYFSTHPQWDQANVEFGKHIDLGDRDHLRLHGGVNYSRVANSGLEIVSAVATEVGKAAATYSYTASDAGVYNGFGARLGLDLGHDLTHGLNAYANGAASLLAGASKSSVTLADIYNDIQYSSVNSFNRMLVVPELDTKLGLKYTYPMTQGELITDAGWLWVNYFNVLSTDFDSFGVQGLFFGLHWHGNIA